jgi:uncharacterized membrane protein YjdF
MLFLIAFWIVSYGFSGQLTFRVLEEFIQGLVDEWVGER